MGIPAQGYAGIKVVRLDWSKVRATFPKNGSIWFKTKTQCTKTAFNHNRKVIRW